MSSQKSLFPRQYDPISSLISTPYAPEWCNFLTRNFVHLFRSSRTIYERHALLHHAGNMNSPIIYRIYIHDSARFLKNPIKSAQSGRATLYYERVERPCTLFSDSPFRAIIQLASGQSSPSLRSFGQQWSSLIVLYSLSNRHVSEMKTLIVSLHESILKHS